MLKALKAPRARKVQREHKALRELKEILAHKACRAHREALVPKDPKAQLERKVPKEYKDPKEQLVHRAPLEHKEPRGRKVVLVLRAIPEHRERKEFRAKLARKERRVFRGRPAQLLVLPTKLFTKTVLTLRQVVQTSHSMERGLRRQH